MRVGRPSLVLALLAPALAGCGLFDGGSTVEDAFEYLPADTFQVRFTEGGIAADDDPVIAWLARAGAAVCAGTVARALFVSEDEDVRLAVQYNGEDDAKDDLQAREALIEEGVDPVTRKPFEDLGDFELEQDGDLLLIDEDFAGGAMAAIQAERRGGGPGVCRPETAG